MENFERCPIDSSVMRWLWEQNKPVIDELSDVLDPLAAELSSHIENDIGERNAVARETEATRIQRGIPFGETYMLPPRLFSELFDLESKAPMLPDNEPDARSLVESYRLRRLQPPLEAMPATSFTTTHEGHMEEIVTDILDLNMRGVKIDPAKWEQYKQAGREQAQNGRYDLDIISIRRANSIKNMRTCPILTELVDVNATGNFNDFMAMPTAALDVGGQSHGLVPVGYLFMAQGEYGPDFAEKLLRTTTYTVNTAGRVLGPTAQKMALDHSEAIAKYTARGRDGLPLDQTLISITQEGARSIMEATTQLMASKVEGYDNPDKLFEAIVKQGVIEQFTRLVPLGLLGPLSLSGKYFPNLLLNKGNGKLIINPSITSELKQAKRQIAARDVRRWVMYWSLSETDRKEFAPPFATSLICPAAFPGGSVAHMSRSMLQAFQTF